MIILAPGQVPQFELQPTYEWRYRYESRENRLFSVTPGDEREDDLTRIRVGLIFKWENGVSAGFQYQIAHLRSTENSATNAMRNSDVTQAYLRFQGPDGTLSLGRQRINIGTERLVGSSDWGNPGRTFDGVRFTTPNWDFFAFRIGASTPLNPRQSYAGLTHRWKGGTTLALYKRDRTPAGHIKLLTLSHSSQWNVGQLQLDADAALQFGKSGTRDHLAWAWHSGAAYRPNTATRLYAEFNAASGGRSTNKERLFDNLLPTNHRFYGQMDLQSWRNMIEIAIGADHKLNEDLTLNASWRRFWLMDSRDAWYGAAGAPNVGINGPLVDPTGAAGKDVGSEIDFQLVYRFRPNLSLAGGYSVFSPGNFVKTLNGGAAARQHWAYFALEFKY